MQHTTRVNTTEHSNIKMEWTKKDKMDHAWTSL